MYDNRSLKQEIAKLSEAVANLSARLDATASKQDIANLKEGLVFHADQVTILRTYGHAAVARSDYAVDPFPVGPTGTQMIEPGSYMEAKGRFKTLPLVIFSLRTKSSM
jgi:hypothetical protein